MSPDLDEVCVLVGEHLNSHSDSEKEKAKKHIRAFLDFEILPSQQVLALSALRAASSISRVKGTLNNLAPSSGRPTLPTNTSANTSTAQHIAPHHDPENKSPNTAPSHSRVRIAPVMAPAGLNEATTITATGSDNALDQVGNLAGNENTCVSSSLVFYRVVSSRKRRLRTDTINPVDNAYAARRLWLQKALASNIPTVDDGHGSLQQDPSSTTTTFLQVRDRAYAMIEASLKPEQSMKPELKRGIDELVLFFAQTLFGTDNAQRIIDLTQSLMPALHEPLSELGHERSSSTSSHPTPKLSQSRAIEIELSRPGEPSISEVLGVQEARGIDEVLRLAFPKLNEVDLRPIIKLPALSELFRIVNFHKKLLEFWDRSDIRKVFKQTQILDFYRLYDSVQSTLQELNSSTQKVLERLGFYTSPGRGLKSLLIDCILYLTLQCSDPKKPVAKKGRKDLRNHTHGGKDLSILADMFGKGIFYLLPVERRFL